MMLDVQNDVTLGFPKLWTVAGYLLFGGAAVFVGRIVYEETILSWQSGPQMVGFAMAHGALPFILIVGLIGLLGGSLWLVGSLILLVRRRFRVSLGDWIPILLLLFLAVPLFVPYEAWEELIVRIAGPGSHGSEFLVQAAGQGKRRFVTLLLRDGFDVNYEDGGGVTPLSGASVEGREEMVGFLISKGADVNRKDHLVGETPLMAAAGMGQRGTVEVLLRNGADPCTTDNEGHTAEGLAKKYHHRDIAEYFSTRFHCQERVIDSCADPSVSACVHP
jgi:hypothetical protein